MDSLPQEIIDKIIDILPRSSLRSSSLVGKRWRERSQQRAFHSILFCFQSEVKKWHIGIQAHPCRISSYVQHADFFKITKWSDPALFSRVLRGFSSLTTLSISYVVIPDEVLEYILCGGLSERITTLRLRWLRSSALVISMILAFKNLQNLFIKDLIITPGEPPLARPITQRRPLDSLRVSECRSRVAEAIANLHFEPRRLSLDVQTENTQRFLVFSSVTVVELTLLGLCSLCVDHKSIIQRRLYR